MFGRGYIVLMISQWIIDGSNAMTRWRRPRPAPAELLLLLPHCLQWSECRQGVASDIGACRRCGQCRIGALAALAEKYGLRAVVVGGGRRAVREVRQPGVRAVVAVACDKELVAGILATLPKPVLAVRNARPCGDCCNTTVEVAEVEKAIVWMLQAATA